MHAAGDTFILLTPAGMRRLAMETTEIGQIRYWRGVTLGRPLSSAASRQLRHQAFGKICFSPTNVRGARAANGDWTITWNRRTRLLPRYGGTGGNSIPLGEASESYEVRIYFSASAYETGIKRILTSGSESVVYTIADQETDWGTGGANTVWVGVTQLSGTVGRGPYYNFPSGGSTEFIYPSEVRATVQQIV
jgi:hypothetical protein